MAGFGGQGVVLMGTLLSYSAMIEGKHTTFFPSYGAEMRGGTANCSVVVSDDEMAARGITDRDSTEFKKLIQAGPGGDTFAQTVLKSDDPQQTFLDSDVYKQYEDLPMAQQLGLAVAPGTGEAISAYETKKFADDFVDDVATVAVAVILLLLSQLFLLLLLSLPILALLNLLFLVVVLLLFLLLQSLLLLCHFCYCKCSCNSFPVVAVACCNCFCFYFYYCLCCLVVVVDGGGGAFAVVFVVAAAAVIVLLLLLLLILHLLLFSLPTFYCCSCSC